MNRLATIQKISKISPIPNADKIEVARILGWDVVVGKGQFKEGDLCVYIEIDTLIPNAPWSAFLFKNGHEEDTTYRLKTVKLRGQISQGLVIPLLEHWITYNSYNTLDEDVTDILGIIKYEKVAPIPNPKSGIKSKGKFPIFLRKTDEVRIQSKPSFIQDLHGKPFYITVKMDGTSATYYKYNKKFGVCSRNLELKDPRIPSGFFNLLKFKLLKLFGKVKKEIPSVDVYWNMAFKYKIEDWLPDGYAIQGEICGPGIQENRLGLNEPTLFVFSLWNIKEQRYENPFELINVTDNIPMVPLVYNKMDNFPETVEGWLSLANITYPNGTPAEGIVVRSKDQSVSFKVINNVFLLKYGE